MPNRENMAAIAKIFKVPLNDLVPEYAAKIVRGQGGVSFHTLSDGKSRLKFDLELPDDVALEIMLLVNKARHAG